MTGKLNVKDLLIRKADQVEKYALLLMEKTLDWQTIRDYMTRRLDEIQLTPQQEKKMERYQFIYNQMVSGKYTEQEIINMLCSKKLYDLKPRQAYEDISYTKELFNVCININKQFEIFNELQIAKKARAKCLELHDFKNAAAMAKVIKDLISMLPDPDDAPGDGFEGHVIQPVFDPTLLGAPAIDSEEMRKLLKTINEKHNTEIKVELFEELIPETDAANQDPL